MTYTFIAEQCSDLPVSVCCRVMKVSTSGFYERRSQPVTDGELAEAHRANLVFDIWKMSRHSYGMPRIRNELRLGLGEGCSRTTVSRLMSVCGAVGIHYKKRSGCTRPGDDTSDDLVNRAFDPDGPDKLWVMDVERHEALSNLAVVKGHRLPFVAADGLKLRAA
jgi:putative transposase